MQLAYSLYLDCIRIFATLLVFVSHMKYQTDSSGLWVSLGHEAVIIFFVLSGLVIEQSRANGNLQLGDYAVKRAARIFSIAVPALLLTVLFDAAGSSLDPSLYAGRYDATDYAAVRWASSLLFLNELWFVSIQFFSNIPYWSLNYEVWYYVLFGLMLWPSRARLWLVGGGLLVVGPKILLLLPIWIYGVFLSKLTRRHPLQNRLLAVAFLLLSLLGIFSYFHLNVSKAATDLLLTVLDPAQVKALVFSKNFLSDYFLALFVGLNFYAVHGLLSGWNTVAPSVTKTIRFGADMTFLVYLLHQPSLLLVSAVMQPVKETGYFIPLYLAVSFGLLLGLHLLTRHNKKWLQNWLFRMKDKAA